MIIRYFFYRNLFIVINNENIEVDCIGSILFNFFFVEIIYMRMVLEKNF